MNDLQKQYQDRWKQHRSRAGNWTKLIVMIAILVGLLYVVNRLGNNQNIDWKGSASRPDTVRTQP